jgi:hypothetical protein
MGPKTIIFGDELFLVVPEREVRIPSPMSDRTALTGCGPSETGDSRTDRRNRGVWCCRLGKLGHPRTKARSRGGDALLETGSEVPTNK